MFDMYAVGLLGMSVCTDLSRDEILRRAMLESPAPGGWVFSDDSAFGDGSPNPHPCERGGGRHHYFLEC